MAEPARLEVGPKQHSRKKNERDGDRNHAGDSFDGHCLTPSVSQREDYGQLAAERFDLDQTA
jgi:hypothetical protein